MSSSIWTTIMQLIKISNTVVTLYLWVSLIMNQENTTPMLIETNMANMIVNISDILFQKEQYLWVCLNSQH